MKKIISVLLITVLLVTVLAGCGSVSNTPDTKTSATPSTSNEASPSQEPEGPEYEAIDMRIAGMTGPTSMGMLLMESADAGNAKIIISYHSRLCR